MGVVNYVRFNCCCAANFIPFVKPQILLTIPHRWVGLIPKYESHHCADQWRFQAAFRWLRQQGYLLPLLTTGDIQACVYSFRNNLRIDLCSYQKDCSFKWIPNKFLDHPCQGWLHSRGWGWEAYVRGTCPQVQGSSGLSCKPSGPPSRVRWPSSLFCTSLHKCQGCL